MNKVSGGNRIPVELFKILSDDALKLLHLICTSEPLKLLSRVQLFAIPWTVAHQAPLSMGILQASGWPCPPPGDLPNPGIEPRSPTLQADSLPSEPPGKPRNTGVGSLSFLQRIF